MSESVKILGTETDLTAATTVGNASLVRVYNSGAAAQVTLKTGATIAGTVTLKQYECINLQKAPTQTLEGGAAFKVVKIAFTN